MMYRNSTASLLSSSPDSYVAYFDEISKYNVHLNFAEKAWAAWYAYMQNDVLATGIMSFTMHELVYFGRSLPWMIADRLPYFNKYQIQNVRQNELILKRVALTSSTAKDPNTRRAMELCQSCTPLPLYRRTTANMAVPPYGAILRPVHKRAIPLNLYDGLPNCHLLRT